jgi:glycosyltransferase involved in cell wall biosynthesis
MSTSGIKEISHKISFIVPCYNEQHWVGELLKKLLKVARENYNSFEIIIVNDGSTDKTAEVLQNFSNNREIILLEHDTNLGKGAAIQSGLRAHTGDIVVIQDADNEYDPIDLPSLIFPIIDNRADVVYGSRFLGGKPRRAIYFSHAVGNKLLTNLSNLITGLNLTDMETGYKAIRSEYLSTMQLQETRFGIEPELTVKLSKIRNIRFYEIGISYYGRSFEEGKKIKWTDGLRALYCLFKYRTQ